MEDSTILCSALLTILLLLLAFNFISTTTHKNLPPTPLAIPLVGHLHLIKAPTHRTFLKLSQKYGPVISLRFGYRLVVVVSSSSAAEECFTENDIVLANRPRFIAGKHFYNYSVLVLAPYGDHWRNLRRICATEIFSPNRLKMFQSVRKDEIKHLLLRVSRISDQDFEKVELKSAIMDLTFNNIMRMISGKRYYGKDVDAGEAGEVRELIAEIFKVSEATNLVDFLPMLKVISKFEKNAMNISRRMDEFLQKLVNEHRVKEGEIGNTMIDHLLSLQESEPEYYTDEIIKGLIWVMVLGGTDTAAVTLEWAMCNVLNHPNVLKKAKEEIDNQVGQECLVDETDLAKLPYLQSIILETLRLFPTAPLLVPHLLSSDCTINGYTVPRDTIVLVNAWAIHRDPNLWDDPLSFKPERFENGVGEGYKLMPFGLGRRACPGEGLAQRIMKMTLGSLIQCFEWKRTSEEKIDMTEGIGLTMHKAQPLVALCKARSIVSKVLQ